MNFMTVQTMACTLVGKVVSAVVVLAVIAGMAAVIVLTVNENNDSNKSSNSSEAETSRPITTERESDLPYRVGVGIADMTGPCVEITFMGYAEVGQRGRGIHTRQFARSFIFAKGSSRVVLVTAEVQAVGIAVRREVVKNLQERYGDMYTLNNVILTGTHTHSTPGGHMVDFILDISILGFSRETFSAYVDGITRTTVTGAQMNRSPFSYDANPKEERARYEHVGNQTDITLTQVKIVREDGRLHGVMNWYAVHTTSMNMTNQLISSDNLGYAALRMEKELNPWRKPGKPEIVAGFFSSNLGDVSPNTQGARCEFSGKECDNQFLICEQMERCFAQGPGKDMMESTKIIGTTVFEGALDLLNTPDEELQELTGDISVRHQFMRMAEQTVPKYNTIEQTFDNENMVKGCYPALGYSFASGTIDGANTMNITQGTLEPMPILGFIASLIGAATEEDKNCHFPKPILLATGRANFPLPWHPHIVSASVVWLGGLAILGVPGEPTTMAGRRMRAAVGKLMESKGIEPKVVVSGLTNEYIHYVTTFEEYQDTEVEEGPSPPDHRNRILSLITPVVLDSTPLNQRFGDCVIQPPARVRRGDVVSATFVGANPRNDLKQEESHAVVERFRWERMSLLRGTSQVTFEWRVPEDAILTRYRIVYHGAARAIRGSLTPFRGVSDEFELY
ncbi:hypothetical protein HF086_008058 [Spodoptera exigua]|uniref:Neutral ceramidase n=1 Tax=Spodoptera exigua TaxID=7107 RepID=A0A922SK07_SPOEX|nr:hypothetical protein HF086_008058 [Spodoptera exigua]